MRLLVTGATGFIGRHAIAQLAARDAGEVIAVSRNRPADLPGNVRHEAVDLLAPGASTALIERVRPSHLLHLAWTAVPGEFWRSSSNLDWAASTASMFSAFAAAGGVRAVFAGSGAEYGWQGPPVLMEDRDVGPTTPYGIAKDATRRLVLSAGEVSGVSVAWGRIFWLYGPHEPARRLVSDVACKLARGEAVDTSEGLQERDFLHVDDVAGAFVAALFSDWAGAFNIGSGEAVAVRDVVAAIARAAGRADLVHLGALPTSPTEPPRLVADVGNLRDRIGFTPRIGLEDGLASTYRWWVDHVRR